MKLARIFTILIFGIFLVNISTGGLISDIGDALGIGDSEKISTPQVIDRTATSDTFKTSNGFQTTYYPSQVNIEYNSEFIPVEDYINVEEVDGKIKVSTLDDKEGCFISLNYQLKDSKEVANPKINIEKNRGSYYFTTDTEKEVDSMAYDLDCKDISFNDEQKKLVIDDKISIDFKQAEDKQDILTTYNEIEKKLEFSPVIDKTTGLEKNVDLSMIDPTITYNFNAPFQGINMFAKECETSTTTVPPSDGAIPSACSSLLDITNNAALDSSDNSKVTTTSNSHTDDVWQVFYGNLSSIPTNDITLINWTWEGLSSDSADVVSGYLWNNSASSWLYRFNTTSTTDVTLYAALSGNVSDFINSSSYTHFLVQYNALADLSRSLATDLVSLKVTYDDLVINSPTANQEFQTSYITLNTSQTKYNNTIWYTYDNGLTNHTLCTNSNECQSNIFIPDGGSNTLKVYANDSSNNIVSKSVSFTLGFTYIQENATSSSKDNNGNSWAGCSGGSSLKTHDNDYSTYGCPYGYDWVILNYNYDLSAYNTTSIIWQVKYQNTTNTYQENMTLPSECQNAGKNVSVILNSTSGIGYTMDLMCYNYSSSLYTTVKAINGGTGNIKIFEEQLIYNYEGIRINSLNSSQEILNTLSTNLNISSIGYTNTIWYTWNNGIKNYTLCTNCGENSTTITFPRQGYYNLTVWGNKSNGIVISYNVNNLFVGNQSNIINTTLEDVYAQTQYGYSKNPLMKFDLTPLNNYNVHGNSTFIFYAYIDQSFTNPKIIYTSNQSWTESISCSQFNSLSEDLTYDSNLNVSGSIFANVWTQFDLSTLLKTNKESGYNNFSFYIYSSDKYCDVSQGMHDNVNLTYDSNAGSYGTITFDDKETSQNKKFINVKYYPLNSLAIITNLYSNNTNSTSSNQSFTYNISDDNDYLNSISIYLDGVINQTLTNYPITANTNNSLNFTINNIPEGIHTYFISATDSDNAQTNGTTQTFTIDSTQPSIIIISPSNNTNSSNVNLSVNYIASDTHLSLCYWTNNSGVTNYSLSNCQTNITNQNWKQGQTNIIIYVIDSFGNINSSTVSFLIDNIPPPLNWLYPTDDGAVFDGYTNTFNYSVSDSGIGLSACWWSNSSGAYNYTISCGTNITDIETIDGSYNITLWANDTLNNVNSIIRTFVINSLDPVVTLISPLNDQWWNSGTNRIFNFTVTDTHLISQAQLWGNWSGWHLNQTNQSAVSNLGTIFNFDPINLSDGNYIWNVWANESNGRSSWYGINRTFHIDTLSPFIALISPQNTSYNTTSIDINFTATDINRANCWYNINNTIDIPISCNNLTFVANQGSSILNLSVNDSAGNINSTQVTFFVDSIYPLISFGNGTLASGTYVNQNNVYMNTTWTELNFGSITFFVDVSHGFGSLQYEDNFTDPASTTEGTHSYWVRLCDTLNNCNSTETRTIILDRTSPLITNITKVTTAGDRAFTFNYNLTELNPSSCSYSLDNGLTNATIPSCISNNISAIVLVLATDYNLTIYSTDLAGNINSSTILINIPTASTTPPGGGGATTLPPEIVEVPSNRTFCGDNICHALGNDLGVKEDFYTCPQDCPGFNPDSALFGCFSADPTAKCLWDQEIFKKVGLLLGLFILLVAFTTIDYKNKQVPVHKYVYLKVAETTRGRK